MLTGKVTDYVTTILPLALVRRAATILAEINDPRLDKFTLALETAIGLSHKQRSLAAIAEVLGDLGHGDALAAIASKLAGAETGPAPAWERDRWDEWARGLTGRASLEGVARATLRNEIAAMIVGAPALKRERDRLLDAVRAMADDGQMTADAAVEWLREAGRETQSL